jgi:hypothetical protein
MEARDSRIEFTMEADISDGTLVFDGTVSNVSRKGVMLLGVPKKFDFYSPKCVAVINGAGKNFKLLMKPRWSKVKGERKDIGFQIISPSLNWIRFVNELDGEEFAVSATLH